MTRKTDRCPTCRRFLDLEHGLCPDCDRPRLAAMRYAAPRVSGALMGNLICALVGVAVGAALAVVLT